MSASPDSFEPHHPDGNGVASGELPLVTIVVPSYNHARHLAAAIDSVLAQDYPRVELIVIDDGSKDNSRGVLERYGDRFQWAVQSNAGQAATLNKGWAWAHGEILSYLSADDRLLPHAVSSAVAHLQRESQAIMAYGDFNLVDEHGRIIRRVHAPDFSYFDLVVRTVCAPGPGVFFTRRAYEATGGWNPAFRQWPDYEFWLRLGLRGPFVRVPHVLAEFRVHDASQTFARVPFDRAEEPVRALNEYYARGTALPSGIREARARALSSAYLASAQLHFRSARPTIALARVASAARLHWKTAFSPRALRLCLHGLLARPAMRLRLKLQGRTAEGEPQ